MQYHRTKTVKSHFLNLIFVEIISNSQEVCLSYSTDTFPMVLTTKPTTIKINKKHQSTRSNKITLTQPHQICNLRLACKQSICSLLLPLKPSTTHMCVCYPTLSVKRYEIQRWLS